MGCLKLEYHYPKMQVLRTCESERSHEQKCVQWFTSPDPLAHKRPWESPYSYCGNNPINRIDPTGLIWEDLDGNVITDHSNIKVYIFYDPRSSDGGGGFAGQSRTMAEAAIQQYGAGSVAMSNVTTAAEFAQDWGDMASPNIREVNINHHGSNQAIHLSVGKDQYITATGDGTLNRSGRSGDGIVDVQKLPAPSGNISNAQLNLNTCNSNNRNQPGFPITGSGLTLMGAFSQTFDFRSVRGSSSGVSYDRGTQQPFAGRRLNRGTWDFMWRPVPQPLRHPGEGLSPK